MFKFGTVILAVATIFMGCSELDVDPNASSEKESSYHATFLDMTFKGVLIASNDWAPERTIEQQLLYTIGQLNGERAVGRIDKVEITDLEVTGELGNYRFAYTATMPVAWGLGSATPDTYEFILPVDMTYLNQTKFTENYSETCVDYNAHDVTTGSMWYYYRPHRRGCEINEDEVHRALATVKPSTLQTEGKYPEYDEVWKDDRLEVVAIFGRADEERPASSDIGTRNFRQFIKQVSGLIPNGISIPSDYEGELGVDVTEMMIEGQLDDSRFVSVTVLVVDNVRTAGPEFEARYKALTPSADLIIYNGHAGLGQNIKALASKGDWKSEQYVIVYMNGCDTYAYVDDALYAAHRAVNPDDETGTQYVDLVTNAMPAYFRDMTAASMALIKALANPDEPATYDEIFSNIAKQQLVLVSGEHDNVFKP
jgi:hypothetical protein